jgi:predicted enzyme related to lactoylglutathione lyase
VISSPWYRPRIKRLRRRSTATYWACGSSAKTASPSRFDANGTTLRISTADGLTPRAFTVLGWTVKDIASAVRQLQDRGVALARYPWVEQDELGVWTTPDGSRVAWFTDPDGNVLSLTQLAG